MNKAFKNLKTKELITLAVVLILLAVLVVLRIYKCPLDFFFGIPCPMCGITRSFLSLLQGDITMAFYYHPLWPVILLAAVLYVLYLFGVISPSRRFINIAGYTLCVLLIVCFIIRHLTGSPVVKVHFNSSLIYRIYEVLISLSRSFIFILS